MKNLLATFLAFFALLSAAQESANNDYLLNVKDSKLELFESVQARVDALQIPDDNLGQLGTSELLNVCLDFPYNIDMFAYDSPEKGFDAVCKRFNGYRELLTRADLAEALIAECGEIPTQITAVLTKDEVEQGGFSFRCYMLFYMLGLHNVTSSMDADMRAMRNATLKASIERMSEYPEVFGVSYDLARRLFPSAMKAPVPGDWKTTSRTTPNGYSVEVMELLRNDYSSTEKKTVKNMVQNEYHVEVLSEATFKYNCHAYAWHISHSNSNDYVWMNYPDIYWNSGAYYEVPEKEAEVVYYVGTHSAIRKNSNEYVSKWGAWPLVKHAPLNVPADYGTNMKYYKRYWPKIVGDAVVSSTSSYSVDPLPEGYTVEWSLSDSYYNMNCFLVDVSGTGGCTIKRDNNREMNNATLTATIKRNGYVATTITKTVHAYSGFRGTYNIGNKDESLTYPYLIYMPFNNTLIIKSPNLIKAKVTYDGTFTPSNWVFDEYGGQITAYIAVPPVESQPTYGQLTLVINVTCQNGDFYRIVVFRKEAYRSLSTQMNGNLLEANLVSDSSESASNDNEEWAIDVFDVTTNENKASQRVLGSRNVSVDTSGWKPGIYVVRATCGDEVLTKKLIIK